MAALLSSRQKEAGLAYPPQLDPGSPVPLYFQLQEILRQEIEAGRWVPGDLLPSESEMNETFDVSRTVTRNALDVLAADGLVYRVKGRGTIVAAPKTSYFGSSALRNWQMEGGNDSALVLAAVVDWQSTVAGEIIGRILGFSPSVPMFEMTYLLNLIETPASIVHYLFVSSVFSSLQGGDIPDVEIGGPDAVTQLANQNEINLSQSRLTIEASTASDYESKLLDISRGAPIFVLTTVDRDETDKAVGFGRSVVRSDLFRFSVDLE